MAGCVSRLMGWSAFLPGKAARLLSSRGPITGLPASRDGSNGKKTGFILLGPRCSSWILCFSRIGTAFRTSAFWVGSALI